VLGDFFLKSISGSSPLPIQIATRYLQSWQSAGTSKIFST